jgi:hypothetical protein
MCRFARYSLPFSRTDVLIGSDLIEPGRIELNEFGRRAICGAMLYGKSLTRLRQANEPINDVRDASITADHARVHDIHPAML